MKSSCQAFLNSSDQYELVESTFSELNLSTDQVFNDGFSQTLQYLSSHTSPDLMLVALSPVLQQDQSQALIEEHVQKDIHQLANVCEPGTKVIVLGPSVSLQFYKQLLEMGIADYLPLPLERTSVVNALQTGLGLNASPNGNRSKHLVITGLQGGVGSTMLAAAMSQNLADSGAHTLLADIDYELGDISTYWSQLSDTGTDAKSLTPLGVEQISHMHTLSRAQQTLSDRLSYLPVRITAEDDVQQLSQRFQSEANWVVWDVPRHHASAKDLWQQANVCVWVLEPSVGVLRHWHTIKKVLDANNQQQKHIFVVNQTRKERNRQISFDQLESVFQQSVVRLPYAPSQAISAANLGDVRLLQNLELGRAIDALTATAASRSIQANKTALPAWLNKILGAKATAKKSKRNSAVLNQSS